MTTKLVAEGSGDILYSEGDCDALYGIASLSKIWASVLIHARIKDICEADKISVDDFLNQPIENKVDYESMVYSRMEPRFDLQSPDDPFVYRPFRKEKSQFRLPVEREKSYTIRTLFEAALFQSKNDAIQALTDHFFKNDDNHSFRDASMALAQKYGLTKTKIGDPHGLCDGDNVSTARDWVRFCVFLIQAGHVDFLRKFNTLPHKHTAQRLFENADLIREDIHILLAKTATGNDRRGHDLATSLMVLAEVRDRVRIVLTLSDDDMWNSVSGMLLRG